MQLTHAHPLARFAFAVPVNDAPVISNQNYTTLEDTNLVVNAANGLLAGSSDVEGDALAVVNTTRPANGTLTVARNGSFTYVPSLHFFGRDSFDYVVTDGNGAFVRASVAITIGAFVRRPLECWHRAVRRVLWHRSAGLWSMPHLACTTHAC